MNAVVVVIGSVCAYHKNFSAFVSLKVPEKCYEFWVGAIIIHTPQEKEGRAAASAVLKNYKNNSLN